MSEVPMGRYGAPTPEQPEDSTPSARDPRLLIGGGIGLVVVAAAAAYLFLGGGGTATPTAVSPRVHHSATPTATSAAVIPVGKPTAAVRTFNGDVGRDPFLPLVTPAPAATTTAPKPTSTAPVATTTATTPGTVVGPGGVSTTGLPGGVPPTNTPPPTVIPTATPTPTKVMVVLKAIAFHGTTPYVVVSYSGVQYMMKTGDSAGASLKVLAIAPDDGTATFQLGDQTFDLHIGQSYVD
jgi:hypothetical protein